MSEGDYVLGTQDEEIARLGLQHRVWRGRMLEAFRRAGIRPGDIVVDVGAGPGFATADLADLVGSDGQVVALERAPHFVAALRARALPNVDVREQDVSLPFAVAGADASWCRWLLSFVPDAAATVRNIADALRPGGVAIFHEYAAYSTWRSMPPDPLHERFRSLVEQSWRDSGGEPDAALSLPRWLSDAGFEIRDARLHSDVITPADHAWEWPRSFMAVNARRLHQLGYVDADEAGAMAVLLDEPATNAHMMTPVVAEIIARKS